MSVRRFFRLRKGVKYYGVQDTEARVRGVITNGDRKWELTGVPKINTPRAEWLKHGNEVQITIWAKIGSTIEKPRTNYATQWDTVEVFFTPEVWHELVTEYYKYMRELAEQTVSDSV
jgi:hypothetical protein